MADGNVSVGGQVDVLGNVVTEYFIGNGAYIVGTLPITGNVDIRGNVIGTFANVDDITATFGNVGGILMADGNVSTSGQVDVLGNVLANVFFGNGAFLTGIIHPPISNMDIQGNVIGTYANVDNIVAISGAIGNVLIAGGNVNVRGQVDIRGNVMAGYFVGNGALLFDSKGSGNQAIDIRGNAIGEYANVDGITANAGNIGDVQMSGGNVSVRGQVDVRGNVTAGYFIGDGSKVISATLSPIAAVDIRGNVIGAYSNVGNIIAIFGNIGNVTFENNTMRVGENMTVIGDVMAEYIIGNGATFDTANVSGNMHVIGQVNVLGNVSAGYFIGNGALLHDVVAKDIPPEADVDIRGNVDGTYANVSTLVATIGNIGNVGFANGSVNVSGNIHAAGNISAMYFIGNNAILSGVYVQPNVDIRGNANGVYANVGEVIAISGNIGNVRMTGGDVSVSGNINVAGTMAAKYFIGDGSLVTLPRRRSARYLSVCLSQDQSISSGTWGNRYILMNTILEGRGITYNTSSGEFTLEKGITYRITAQLTWKSVASSYYYPFRVFDKTTGTQIGIMSEALPCGSAANNTGSSALDMIYTPSITITCGLRMGPETGNASRGEKVRADLGTFLNIVEVSDVFLLQLPPIANTTIHGNLVGNYANVDNITALVGNIGNVILENGNIAVSGQANVRGNVAANFFFGNGSQLKNLVLTGQREIDIIGNVDGNYVSVRTVQATSGNIGYVRMENGNVHVMGQVNVLGDVTAGYFIGNGALLTNVAMSGTQVGDIIGNVDGNYINVNNVNASILGYIGNVVMERGSIFAPGQVDIVSNVTGNCFIGDGAELTDMVASSELQTVDIRGNVKGSNVNVVTITAIAGNIGNVKMEGGHIVATYFANIGNVAMITVGKKGPDDRVIVRGQANVVGKVTANCFIGDGAMVSNVQLVGIRAFDIRGNVTGHNINVHVVRATMFGNIGNVWMENGNITASYANIGNVQMGNGHMRVSGQVDVMGNVTAEYLVGNGALLSNIKLTDNGNFDIRGNVHGNYITVSNVIATMFGNIGHVRFSKGIVTANIGNIGNVIMEAGNISATGATIGGVVMLQGNLDVAGQVNALGNVSAGYFIGDGSELTGITAPLPPPFPPKINVDIIGGNLIGNNINVHIVKATTGNVGNIRMNARGIRVGGQVNVRGNIVANTFIGNIISSVGNIGNTILRGGNVNISGQVNALGDIVANVFIGDGLGIYNAGMPTTWLSLGRRSIKSVTGSWKNVVLSSGMAILSQSPGGGISYDPANGDFSLVTGVTYRITAQMNFESRRSDGILDIDRVPFRVWNLSYDRAEGDAIARPIFMMKNTGPDATACPILDVIIKAKSTTGRAFYDLRCTDFATAGINETLIPTATFINIVSLSGGPTPAPDATLVQSPWIKTPLNFSATAQKQEYMWSITGKIMSIKGYYSAPENTTHPSNDEYLLSIPGDYTVDTTITGVAPSGVTDGVPIGKIQLCTSSSQYVGEVLAYNETSVKFIVWSPIDNIRVSVGSGIADIRSLYFTADVPIQ